MKTEDLLEKLISAVEASTKTVQIVTPSTDYYARRGDYDEDTLDIIDPDQFVQCLTNVLQEIK